jgi:hypothetical protein
MYIFYFESTSSGHNNYVSEDVRNDGSFPKPKGACDQKSWRNTVVWGITVN